MRAEEIPVVGVFQSPCAGNMFGKLPQQAANKLLPIAAFQSPCAGNMFGKALETILKLESALGADEAVSIPVCGEHVW